MTKTDTVDIVNLPPVTLAVTKEIKVSQSEIAGRIGGLYDKLYGWLGSSKVKPCGQNHAFYRHTPDGMYISVGVPVDEPFVSDADVDCFLYEGGPNAHTCHIGPYSGIPAAFGRVHDYCAKENLNYSGLNVEIYGDHGPDPSKLVTDVYVGLKS